MGDAPTGHDTKPGEPYTIVRRKGTPSEYTVTHIPYHSWTVKKGNKKVWQVKYPMHGKRFHPEGFWIDPQAESEAWSIPRGEQWQQVESVYHPTRVAIRNTKKRLGLQLSKQPTHADWLEVARMSTSYRDRGRYILFSCPGHDDKDPSCSVYPDRFTTAKCHSCGETWTLDRAHSALKDRGSK